MRSGPDLGSPAEWEPTAPLEIPYLVNSPSTPGEFRRFCEDDVPATPFLPPEASPRRGTADRPANYDLCP